MRIKIAPKSRSTQNYKTKVVTQQAARMKKRAVSSSSPSPGQWTGKYDLRYDIPAFLQVG